MVVLNLLKKMKTRMYASSAVKGLRHFVIIICTWPLAQFGLYMHKGGLKHSFHFIPFSTLQQYELNQGVECAFLHYWNEEVRYRLLLLYVYNFWLYTRFDRRIY